MLIYLHGGAYYFGPVREHWDYFASISASTKMAGLMIDYRMAPMHPFPQAPEDCLAVAKLFAPRKPEEALAWVERGRALDREKPFRSGAVYDLDKLHRELLTRLGRQNEGPLRSAAT